jgi:adenylate kinase
MRLILMGPPGAGKGTQAKVISGRLEVPAISTGDIFRANVSEGTPLGRDAKRYMDAGDYVPDEITNAMVRDRLSQDDAREGFLLDGYPRTVAQVNELDSMLAAVDASLDAVVVLTVEDEVLVQRLLHRAETEGRTDDTEDVIRHRQDVYNEQTAPLLGAYAGRGLLVKIDGMGGVDEVSGRIMEALDRVRDPAAG